jgi:class 3 adenylate cyclase
MAASSKPPSTAFLLNSQASSRRSSAQFGSSKKCRNAAGLTKAQRLVFRVGINIGDVLSDGHDIFDDDVNIAAQLEALCEPGGICISRAAREQIRDKLPLDFTDYGVQRPLQIFGLSADMIAIIPGTVAADISCGFASDRDRTAPR